MQRRARSEHVLLVLLFVFALVFRLYFAFKYSHFSTDNAYFHFRQIEHVVENYSMLTYDELSYGGRQIFYPPLFHVAMALFSFGSVFMLKIIPELLFALTVFVVYKIAKDISGNSYAALFAASLSAFIPIVFAETVNNLSVYSFVVPLLLLILYSSVKLEDKKYLWIFVVVSFLLPLTHPSSLIFVLTIVLYFLLIAGGAFTSTRLKKEAAMFSVFLTFLFQFIIYKDAFFKFGAEIVKHNIPSNILADSFRGFTPLDLLVGIGGVPLVLGAVGVYLAFVREKSKTAYMFGAFGLSVLLLLVLRLLTLSVGLMFLGFVLSIFSSLGVKSIYSYFDKFRLIYVKHIFVALLLLLFAGLSVSPSYIMAGNSVEIDNVEIREIEWLAQNTDQDDVILANINEGNLIAAIAKRKTVADTNFLFAPDPIERVEDIRVIFTTVSEAIALKTAHKYGIDVIYLSDDSRREHNILELTYAESSFDIDGVPITEGSKCFDVFRRGTYYVVKC